MKSFNINNYIKFKLTESGLQLLKEYEDETSWVIGRKCTNIKPDKDGYYKMQMWSAIEVFKWGIGIAKGECPFVDCGILFDGKDLKEVK